MAVAEIDGLSVEVDVAGWPSGLVEAVYGGLFELAERRACRRLLRPGDRVVEFGTALGLVAMTAARIVGAGRVVTFEAEPALVPRARASAAANGLDIDVRHAAVVDAVPASGTVAFHRQENFAGSSTLDLGGDAGSIAVPAVAAIDVVRALRPDALIIDIEGGEAAIGAALAESEVRTLLLEMHPHAIGLEGCLSLGDDLVASGLAVVEEASDGQVVAFMRQGEKRTDFDRTAAALVLQEIAEAPPPAERVWLLERAIRRAPKSAAVRLRLGEARFRVDDLAGAAREARAVIAAEPDRFEAHLLLARVERRRGRLDRAIRLLAEAAAASPRILVLHQALEELHAACADETAAAAAAAAAAALLPEATA